MVTKPKQLQFARRDRHGREAQSLQGDDPSSWRGGSESSHLAWDFSHLC